MAQMAINLVFFFWLLLLTSNYQYLHNWVKNIYNWIHR